MASIATRLLERRVRLTYWCSRVGPNRPPRRLCRQQHWGNKLHSFCIGLEGSPDLDAAKKVANFLGTIHHTYTFSVQEGLDAVSDVIFSLETYDTTTIRAATPMYLMSRKIKALGVKMVLSGEGADEIFGGYLYFHKAPSASELHHETVRKLKDLHLYDCCVRTSWQVGELGGRAFSGSGLPGRGYGDEPGSKCAATQARTAKSAWKSGLCTRPLTRLMSVPAR